MSSLELGQTLLSPKQVPNERLVLISLNDTYGSGKVERIEDKTPFYLLVYNEKRIFSRKIKSFTLEEIIIKIVYDASGTSFKFIFKIKKKTNNLFKQNVQNRYRFLFKFYQHILFSQTHSCCSPSNAFRNVYFYFIFNQK